MNFGTRGGSKKSHDMKREIIPVILAKDAADFKKKLAVIKTLRPAPRMVQVDIVDEKFAPYRTWNNPIKAASLLRGICFEVDLMTINSLRHAKAWQASGASRVFFHTEREASKNPREIIKYLHSHAVEVGISLNPDTPLSSIQPYLSMIDAMLLLGVNPGKSGQKFQPKILAKIRTLRKAHPRLPIEVDGGVNLRNARALFQAGATRLATASALLGADDPQMAWKRLTKMGIKN